MTTSTYRSDIDGLRAIAIGSVVAYHGFPNLLPGGFVGVDVFFVISGYLISSHICAEAATGKFRLSSFYARRIRRILPALSLMVACSLAFGWLTLTANEFELLTKHVAASAGFVSNITLWRENGYFDVESTVKPLLHLWSLGVEEQFYILWPLALIATVRMRLSTGWMVGMLTVLLFVHGLIATASSDTTFAFYFPTCRFWELLLGAALAIYAARSAFIPNARVATTTSVLGIVLLVGSVVLISHDQPFPGWRALFPVVGALLVIAAGNAAIANRTLLAQPVMVLIGKISYPLYLWHWPILSFQSIFFQFQDQERPTALVLADIAASVVLAWLTYRFVEHPIRFGRVRFPVVPSLVVCNAALLVIGWLLFHFADADWAKPRLSGGLLDRAVFALKDAEYPPHGAEIERVAAETAYHLRGTDTAIEVLYIGDSTMEHFAPRVAKVIAETERGTPSATFLTQGGCRPIPGVTKNGRQKCLDFVRTAYAYAERSTVRTVVIGGAWHPGLDASYLAFIADDGTRIPLSNEMGRTAALASLDAAIARLRSLGKQVFIIQSVPGGLSKIEILKSIPLGVRFGLRDFNDFPTEFHASGLVNSETRRLIADIAARNSATVIDPVPFMCRGTLCSIVAPDGTLAYRDSMHLTAGFARGFASFIDQTLIQSHPAM